MTVRGRWFPAAAVLPEHQHPWQRCLVLAAEDGLHIFRRRSETADWHSPIQWDRTVLPADGWAARNGLDLHTTAGLVVVTAGGGCGCGSPLKSWPGPSWARSETIKA